MSTGLFHTSTAGGIGARAHQRKLRQVDWPKADTERLCDIIADGGSFQSAADQLGKTKGAIASRWQKIVRAMGAQAR